MENYLKTINANPTLMQIIPMLIISHKKPYINAGIKMEHCFANTTASDP